MQNKPTSPIATITTIATLTIFIFTLFTSEISNYTTTSLYLKLTTALILFLFLLLDYKINNIKLNIIQFKANAKKTLFICFAFLGVMFIGLIYTVNLKFGLFKIIHFCIGTTPLLVATLYFLLTSNDVRRKLFINTVIFWGILFGSLSLILSPYNPTTIYSFEISRWSHVIAGRFLGSVTVIVLLIHFSKDFIPTNKLIGITTLLLTALYFVGMRAALLGIIFLLLLLLIFSIVSKKYKSVISLTISIILSMFIILVTEQFNTVSTERYNQLIVNNEGKFEDGAILARIISYKKSWDVIKKNPITGIGLGGFNNKEILGDIAKIKYPHNLLIEIQLELGLTGTIFFLWLFWGMFTKAYKFSLYIFAFLAFSFWLAMFSKDIATQTQLWIGIVIMTINGNKIVNE
jgi:O-antigen ligase